MDSNTNTSKGLVSEYAAYEKAFENVDFSIKLAPKPSQVVAVAAATAAAIVMFKMAKKMMNPKFELAKLPSNTPVNKMDSRVLLKKLA